MRKTKKEINISKEAPFQTGMVDELIDSLNDWADTYNEFVDVTDEKLEWLKTWMLSLIDIISMREKRTRKLYYILLGLGMINLVAVWVLRVQEFTWFLG